MMQHWRNKQMKIEHTTLAIKDMELFSGYYSVIDCATKLGVSERRVRQFIEEGRLPAIKVGRQYFISKEAFIGFSKLPRRIGRPRKIF